MRRARIASFGLAVTLGTLLAAAPAAACSVCFAKDTSSSMVSGARLGVFLLLGITAAVLGGFAKFFFYLRRRARQAELSGIADEWAQLQRSAH